MVTENFRFAGIYNLLSLLDIAAYHQHELRFLDSLHSARACSYIVRFIDDDIMLALFGWH